MWFATRFGMAVYDGAEWVGFDVGDGLPQMEQRHVECDDAGRVWTVGRNCRCAVYEDGVWTALPVIEAVRLDNGPRAAAVAQAAGGNVLLVATKTAGVHYFTDGSWSKLPLPDGLDDSVYDVTTIGGRVFLASSRGVLVADPQVPAKGAQYHPDIPRRPAMAIAPDRLTSTVWVVGHNFIGRLSNGTFKVVDDDAYFKVPEGFDYLKCEPDLSGSLYIGNPTVLYRWDESGTELLGLHSGLSGDGVTSLYCDREGNMWAGTLRGVTKIVSLRFANYSSDHGLLEDEVTAVLERKNGDIILGHPHGFTLLGDETKTVALDERFESRVLDMTQSHNGDVWAAVNSFGLARIDARGNIEWVGADVGVDNHVTSVLVDRNDRLWVTTTTNTYIDDGGGLHRREAGPDVSYSSDYLRRLFEARDGTIYLGSSRGLFVLKPGLAALVTANGPRIANNVYSFYDDPRGTMWVGTLDGLYFVEGSEFRKTAGPDPVIDRPVYFMAADERNHIWFGTDNGVMRWDGSNLEHYTIDDGLVGLEANRAAGVADSRGRLWIGMDRGVSVYRPRFDLERQVPPLVQLTGVDVNGEIMALDERLGLGPGDNTLSFRFRAPSFTDESKVKFSAWLEGFDDDWLDPFAAPTREIRYTNLPPGRYNFHLRAASAGGTWSRPISSAPIVIDAPLMSKPQFLAFVFLLAALAVWVVVGYFSQKRYARRLESEVRDRAEELRQVESELEKARRIETLGVLAGGIAHDFNNLLTIMMANMSLLEKIPRSIDGQGGDYLRDAMSAARRARSLTQQLLTFSRGGAPVRAPSSMVDIIRESVAVVTGGSKVRCAIDLPDDLWIVDIDVPQMGQVVNNVLLNSMQAMPEGGLIRVSGLNHVTPPRIELEPGRYVEVVIEDKGGGIAPEHVEHVFDPYFSTKDDGSGLGLTTAYTIVKRHEGLLTIESIPGMGTTCRIYLRASAGQSTESTDDSPGIGEAR